MACKLTTRMRERGRSAIMSGHSVDTSTRESGCSAEIKLCTPGPMKGARRAKEDLPHVHGATQEVAANQIGVPPLKRSGWENGSGQNAIPKIRGETCDLAFDHFGVVLGTSIRHVAVSPGSMLANGRSTRVE